MREEREVLRHVADAPIFRGEKDAAGGVQQHAVVDGDETRFRLSQAGHDFEKRGFARARAAENADDLAFDLEVERELKCALVQVEIAASEDHRGALQREKCSQNKMAAKASSAEISMSW